VAVAGGLTHVTMNNEIDLSESDKDEIVAALKQSFGSAIQHHCSGAAAAFFAIALIRIDIIPFLPNSLSITQLAGMGVVFSLAWGGLYLAFSRPHKKRLETKLKEVQNRDD